MHQQGVESGARHPQRIAAATHRKDTAALPVPLTLSVVVCCYSDDRRDVLMEGLDALASQTRTPDEIVVVVDHNPRLRDEVAARGDVTVVENAGAPGLSDARNAGVEASHGSVIAFVDDDATPEPGWAEGLVAVFADPAVVAAGTRIDARWQSHRPPWFPPEFDWVVGCSYTGLPTAVADVRNPIGASMAVRRDALDAVGGFTDRLGRVGAQLTGCEETELCIRLADRIPGARVVYTPRVAVRHLVPSHRGRPGYFLRRCYSEGVSKAVLAGISGTRDGLSSERAYVATVLPRGVARGVRGARRDPWGVARAGMIVAGVAATGLGYVAGRVRRTSGIG